MAKIADGAAKRKSQASARPLPPPIQKPRIAAIFILFATPDERALLFANIKQSLNPGGHLILQGYRPKQLEYKTGGPSEVENLYTRELLQEAFKDFASVEIEEYDAVIQEGAGHGGMSALIDFVGRK